MTWDEKELSIEDGTPIELYKFTVDTLHYRYTSHDEDYEDGSGDIWVSAAVLSSKYEESQSEGVSDVTLECGMNTPFLDLFKNGSPLMHFEMYQVHSSDVDEEVVPKYSGRVVDVVFKPQDWKAVVVCSSYLSSLEDAGLRRKCGKTCPHVLYGPGCGLASSSYEIGVTVSSVSGKQVIVSGAGLAGKDNAYFTGGFMAWTHADLGINMSLMITGYDDLSSTVTLANVPQGLEVGAAKVHPGCDHTLTDCIVKFNDNRLNHGGAPYSPGKNPYGSDPLF